jgi:putative aldouronate transport system permease protein
MTKPANDRSTGKPLLSDLRRHYQLYLLVAPITIYFIVMNYLPMPGLYLAFTDFKFTRGILGSPFIGLANFTYAFEAGVMGRLLRNTILYNLAFYIVNLVLQVGVAVFLTFMHGKYFKKTTQQIILLPHFLSFVFVGTIAYNFLSTDIGIVNGIIERIGGEPVQFYTNRVVWPFLIVGFNAWKSLGYGSVIYLAALAGISPELYESADIDGAGIWQKIRYITLPGIRATIIVLMLFAVGRMLNGQFELFQNLVGNIGPLYATTDIIETFVYRQITTTFDIGLGSAMDLFKSLAGFILIVTVNEITKRASNGEHRLF